jgi:MATE family multidrug resistance protein
LYTAIGGRLGTNYLAANAVLMNFVMLLSFGLDGIAFATEALVGADHGAKDRTRLRQTVRVGFFWAGLMAFAYTLAFALFGHDLVRLLTDMPEVRTVAADYLIWCAAMPLAAVWSYQLDGMFIGLTLTRAMRNTMVLALAVYLAALAVLTPAFGNHGLWASFTIFMLARGLFMGWSYRRVAPAL